jgi:hypothetical protein
MTMTLVTLVTAVKFDYGTVKYCLQGILKILLYATVQYCTRYTAVPVIYF